MLALVENLRRKQLAWVDAILLQRNWNLTQLANAAGIDHSTLSKFRNDPDNTKKLSTSTVAAIENASDVPPYQTEIPARLRGLSEVEAAPYQPAPKAANDPAQRAIEAVKAGRNGLDPWILNSRALENLGFFPGDILMIDLNADPADGDVVCAQVYDNAGRVETVMRVFEKPYLVSATSDRNLVRPFLVDGERVQVRGVAITTIRGRRAA